MNKYNVKAIRIQLNNFAACRNWSAFRKRLVALMPLYVTEDGSGFDDKLEGTESLEAGVKTPCASDKQKLELCRAIIEMKLKSQHTESSGIPSLLHDLCLRFYSKSMVSSRHKYPPVPVDILEMVARLCSTKMFVTTYGKRQQTPLGLLLDQNPPAFVVERLLSIIARRQGIEDEFPNTRLAILYVRDSNDEVPLMQAVKRLPDRDDILQILMHFDRNASQSLLCVDKKGMIPLHYLLHRELKDLDAADDDVHRMVVWQEGLDVGPELPPNLLFLLQRTQEAFLINQGLLSSHIPAVNFNERIMDGENTSEGWWDDCSSRCSINSYIDIAKALRATICCAHQLTNKMDLSKLVWILVQNLVVHNDLDSVDEDGNTFIHWICMCKETDFFVSMDRPLLPFLITEIPGVLLRRNNQGMIPLHVAIEHLKEWPLLRTLLVACPESAKTPNLKRKQLPLHAIISKGKGCYSYGLDELGELWGAYPDAALIADPCTNLLPFQLAASLSDSSDVQKLSCGKHKKGTNSVHNRKVEEENPSLISNSNSKSLSFVYLLLRGAPNALQF
ncbi:hypothetical protein IV203_018022 [Nitzschia inconspicua]|uniref:Ankyrin repeat protein n=1 Tax=Nitzschia inconspicua TaxID=303405 RepID=A0A9K3M1X1_9STRA|nr:hypothetical protein IV203_018022 [Nitzschia inconspicua]